MNVYGTGHAGESCCAPVITTPTKTPTLQLYLQCALTASQTHDFENPVDEIVAFAGEGLAAVMTAKFSKSPGQDPVGAGAAACHHQHGIVSAIAWNTQSMIFGVSHTIGRHQSACLDHKLC